MTRSIGSSMWSMRGGVGHLARVVELELRTVGQVRHVGDRRRRRDERQVELALEALAHDLHVQKAEKPATEPEPERLGRLGLEGEAGVVQPQLLERVAQLGKLVTVDRVEAAEHHGQRVAVALERRGRRDVRRR